MKKNETIFHYNKPSRSCDDEIYYRQRYYLTVSQRIARSDNIYSLFFLFFLANYGIFIAAFVP